MRELMERHPMVAVNEGDQLADLHYVRRGQSDKGQHDRRDSNLSNDPEGVQIETIMLDHENPEEMFSLQSVYPTTWNEKDHFTVFSAIATFVCIVSYVINIGTDVAVCYLLFMENNLWWFGFTATTTVVPVLTVNVFSIRWYLQDAQEKKLTSRTLSKPNLSKLDWTVRIFFHVLLLGPVIRYVDLLKYGLRSRQFNKQKQRRKFEWHFNVGHKPPIRVEQLNDVNYHHLMIEEDRDTAFLALLESFMESAPQLVLQIYILAERESPASFLTGNLDCFVSSRDLYCFVSYSLPAGGVSGVVTL
ncbi:XK-related protein 4-like isoform X2 [Tachypleus tridentatus]|uniref:XK-related protein 4-like isoform X2 n=2 Tax=Tachypleus tridentatus TaxID=6853 RepID=UPI003FD63707